MVWEHLFIPHATFLFSVDERKSAGANLFIGFLPVLSLDKKIHKKDTVFLSIQDGYHSPLSSLSNNMFWSLCDFG